MELINAKLRLLIIGASARELRQYERLLAGSEVAGYSFITPISEETEAETLLASDPDCILLDCDCPSVNHLLHLRSITRLRSDSSHLLPVVALVTKGNETAAVDAMERGAQDFILKSEMSSYVMQHAINGAIDKSSLERRLNELCQFNSEFLARTAKQLQDVLRLIKEFISMTLESAVRSLTLNQTNCLTMALRSCGHLSNSISDLLEPRASDLRQTRRLCRQSTDLRQLIRQSVRKLLPKCQMKLQKVDIVIADNLPAVLCDEDAMTHVFLDIVGRVLLFTPLGGVITIKAHHLFGENDNVVVEVGCTDRNHIHDFENSDSELTSTNRSLKIDVGTAIVGPKDIIEAHDGRILSESYSAGGLLCAWSIPAYTEIGSIHAFVSDSLNWAVAKKSDLVVVFIQLLPSHKDCKPTAPHEEFCELDDLKEIVRHVLRRKDDNIRSWESEGAVIVTACVHGPGQEALGLRIESAIADKLETASSVALSYDVISPTDSVSDWLTQLKDRAKTDYADRQDLLHQSTNQPSRLLDKTKGELS